MICIKLSELDSDDTKIEFETLDLHEMALNCQAMMEIPAEKNEVTVEIQEFHFEIRKQKPDRRTDLQSITLCSALQ